MTQGTSGYLPASTPSTPSTPAPNYSQGNGGFFGNQAYQVQGNQINQQAFTNPVGTNVTAPAFQAGNNAILTAANQQAPTLGPAATSAGAGTTGDLNVANTLYGIGTGAIPGAAAKTAALQGQQNQVANLAAMGSARGTANPALANYNLGNLNAGVQQNTAQNAVVGAANEQMNALGQAGTAYGQVQQNQQFNAGQIQQIALQQATLQAQQMGLQGQELQNYVNNNALQIANSMSGAQAGQTLQSNQNTSLNQIGATSLNNAAGHSIGGDIMNLAGSVASSAGSLAKFSDKKLKTKIKPAKKDLEKFIATMRGVKWVL